MKLTKEQVDVIIKNGQAKGITGKAVLDGLIQRGYEPEGIDINLAKQQMAAEQKLIAEENQQDATFGSETAGDLKSIGNDILDSSQKRADKIQANNAAFSSGEQGLGRTIAQDVGQLAGAGADAISNTIIGVGKAILPQKAEDAISSGVEKVGQKVGETPIVQNLIQKYETLKTTNPALARDIDSALGVADLAANFVGAGAAKAGVKAGTKVAVENVAKPIASGSAKVAANTAFAIDTIENVGTNLKNKIGTVLDKFTNPDVPDAVKVSLNPKVALKESGQDVKVVIGGKVKRLSEITPTENMKLQISTGKSLDSFTKQAEKFANDRSVAGGSPVEIVGSRADKALDFADKKRMAVGKKMGEIEQEFVDHKVPLGDGSLKAFTETVDFAKKPKFGVTTANSEIVKKLVKDFDLLGKSGNTVGERLQFIRNWDSYLQDAKDAFGNFKENATVNTKIQNAIRTLKNETVDYVSLKDKTYRELRKQYASYKELDEIGNKLLGKDGALGERVKGAAIIKRAIQSNSDAGSRQFLIKLRDITGYDAIKEGDLALTAMENVGDYQGLSLLNIIKEGKTGIINRGLEKAQDLIVGTKAKRVKNYIKK